VGETSPLIQLGLWGEGRARGLSLLLHSSARQDSRNVKVYAALVVFFRGCREVEVRESNPVTNAGEVVEYVAHDRVVTNLCAVAIFENEDGLRLVRHGGRWDGSEGR